MKKKKKTLHANGKNNEKKQKRTESKQCNVIVKGETPEASILFRVGVGGPWLLVMGQGPCALAVISVRSSMY